MPKLRYSWPFYFAILGNLFFWEELTQEGIYSLVKALDLVRDREYYMIGLLALTCISMVFITGYQLWINRFPKDQKWSLLGAGILFLGGVFSLIMEVFGSPNPDFILIAYGAWCLIMTILYALRQWAKPLYLKSKLTLPKNITVMLILGSGALIGILTLARVFHFSFYGGKTGALLGLYLLILQIGLPLAMLFNMLDHHARYKGRGFAKKQLDLIEELGE